MGGMAGMMLSQKVGSIYTPLAGSLLFNGTSQSLILSPGMTIGTSAYTVEGWFYNNSGFLSKGMMGTNETAGMHMFANATDGSTISLDRNGGLGAITYQWPAGTLQTNKWQYIVLNRDASTNLETMWIGTFVNTSSYVTCARATTASGGVSPTGGTTTDNYNWSGASNWVGKYYGGYWPGYITNFRVTIGAARYSSSSATITAPNAPLTTNANTKYLMLGAVITTDSSGTQTIINDNTVTQTATIPF